MKINTLEQMETVVNSNKTLFWDGWTVVDNQPSERGRTANNGAFINGKWHIQKRYAPTRDGWEIPNKFMR